MEGSSSGGAPTITHSPFSDREIAAADFSLSSFGDYELLQEIARGGMGVVFKAKHRQLNRTVALKMILHGRLASKNEVLRFRQEAEAVANLDHPGIVPIYEIGENEGRLFYSMKFVEGGALSEHLGELRQDTRAVVDLIAKVARAVHHAHQRGILHRDIKPANILLDEEGNPLVTDFGLAKHMESESDITHTGAIVGTPAYMPPEQASGKKDITTAADIYSIGAILYEALTGSAPHSGDSPMETLLKVMNDELVPPRQINRKIDRTLELICRKCLQRDPNQRYSSAGALADDLENWLSDKPVSVRAPSFAVLVGDVFRSNLRSAIGAAVIGIAAGTLLALGFFSFSLAPLVGHGRQIDPYSLYGSFSKEVVPNLWFSDLPQWIVWPGLLTTLLVLFFTGLVVQTLVRPKSSEHALAIGVVTGLMMTIAIYSVYVGFLAVANVLEEPLSRDVELLARAGFSTAEAREEATTQFFDKYPQLEAIEAARRPALIREKFGTDATLAVPRGILLGLLLSATAGLIPCVACTLAAHRLYNRKRNLPWIIIPYLEIAFWLFVLIVSFCAWELFQYMNIKSGSGNLSVLGRCVFYLVVALLIVPGYRMWPWQWRYSIYACAIIIFWFFAN